MSVAAKRSAVRDYMQGVNDERINEISTLVESVKPLFAGKPPPVQGAALACLTAIWLGGHLVRNSTMATRDLQLRLLSAHTDSVKKLLIVERRERATQQGEPK